MSVFGIGIDLVEIGRIQELLDRHGDRFLARVFTTEERAYCDRLRAPAICYAARFAAKEAVAKAFGTGIGASLGWLDITVVRDENGKPAIRLQANGAQTARQLGIGEVLISLTHTQALAAAHAVATRA